MAKFTEIDHMLIYLERGGGDGGDAVSLNKRIEVFSNLADFFATCAMTTHDSYGVVDLQNLQPLRA